MSLWDTLGFGNKSNEPAPQQVIVQQAPEPTPVEPEAAPFSKQAEWFTPAETDAKPVEFDTSKLFNSDPAQLAEAIGGLNFIQGAVTPELQARIEAGGPEATQAMLSIVNKSNQSVMQAALQANAKMIENALAKAAPVYDQKVQQQFKSREIEEAIRESNPVFASPSGKFMLDAVRDAMLKKFPNATSAQIADNAKTFISEMIQVGGPQEVKQDPNKDIMGTDWGSFLATK